MVEEKRWDAPGNGICEGPKELLVHCELKSVEKRSRVP